MLEENKALKDLTKMPLDDEMTRNVARRELAREKNIRDNRREHVKVKRNHKTKRYREETKKAVKVVRKKKCIKGPSRKKRKTLDKKKAKARVKVKARARKRSSKRRRRKKLIKCQSTYRKNQNNLNLYRVNRI